MKALIICDDSNLTPSLNLSLKELSYDTINYKWLLKALDNVEEIQPDLVVINVSDYPRHWKTFSSYISTYGYMDCKVLLVVPEAFSEEEMEKAEALNVSFVLSEAENLTLEIKNALSLHEASVESASVETESTFDDEIPSVDDIAITAETENIELPVSSEVPESKPEIEKPKKMGSLLQRINSIYGS